MKILLTGADGFTGRPFAQRARAAGHEIVALRTDLTHRDDLRREVLEQQPDAVVHLAAISFVGHAAEEDFYAINVIGTTNLLDALVQLPSRPKRVLLASSANIYGNTTQSPIAETQPPAPVNHYAMSKLAMEYMAHTYTNQLDLVITRPFNYTGPGQNSNFLIPKLAEHFAARAPFVSLGNLHVEREFNDIQMICDAYLLLLAHGKVGEAYNVCSGQPYTLQHIIDTFEELTGHIMKVDVDPRFVRPNEVHRLCGNPDKLQRIASKHGIPLQMPLLKDTLQRMLASTAPGWAPTQLGGGN
ncbi:NAD-dependent epimerase/dehydratase family protein [Variovorax sp. EL159]|uniref:NAD-dependent epimerase/dehydratase family protein n=1 Tax=Variovorax sp. EL159 TaxID=1566270 RepID=UPI000886A4B7|nr:NAD-dependent epimerase/dehydratase family protein [Variovorax sp. EL159]SCX72731.1 Nucleoside-diphosphate-sugar epimerase [Variovorax sp. EL159]